MIVYKCDKCGKELRMREVVDVDIVGIYGDEQEDEYELCHDCALKLQKWLESGKEKE